MSDMLPISATQQERAISISTSRAYSLAPTGSVPNLRISGNLIIPSEGLFAPPDLIFIGYVAGFPRWSDTGDDSRVVMVYWDGLSWNISSGENSYWNSYDNVTIPHSGMTWENAAGSSGTPVVSIVPIDFSEQPANIPIRSLWNADNCPLDLLPWLAWTLSVDTWNASWPEEIKRAVVRSSINTHRIKGTAKSVKDALGALGAGTALVEWFQKSPTGTPHTFTVYIVSNDVSLEMQAAMVSEIDRTKPLRSHYDIVFGVATEGSINMVGVLRPAVFTRLDGGAIY